MLSALGKIFSRQNTEIFFSFFPEKGFDISCQLCPVETSLSAMETVCMKCQILFSEKTCFPENRFDISCKLSPMEKTCMKCQIFPETGFDINGDNLHDMSDSVF